MVNQTMYSLSSLAVLRDVVPSVETFLCHGCPQTFMRSVMSTTWTHPDCATKHSPSAFFRCKIKLVPASVGSKPATETKAQVSLPTGLLFILPVPSMVMRTVSANNVFMVWVVWAEMGGEVMVGGWECILFFFI